MRKELFGSVFITTNPDNFTLFNCPASIISYQIVSHSSKIVDVGEDILMRYYYLKRHQGIFKYFQNGNTKYGYRLRYTINHKQHEKSRRGFSSLTNALKAFNTAKLFTVSSNNKGNLTVKAWCHHYLNMIKPPVRKISTYMSYKRLLDENIIPILGNFTLNDLTLDNYQTHIINHLLKKGLSRRTVMETNARFQTVINYAVKSRYISINPIKFATISNINNRPRKVIMSNKELKQFNTTLDKEPINIRVLFYTLEDTGMRIGELLALHWDDMDLNHHVVYIRHTRDELGIRKPKTNHSYRHFQVTDGLNKLLSKYKIYCKKHFKVDSHTLILLNNHGDPFSTTVTSKLLRKLLIKSGLTDLVHRFTPHSFRHQFISYLISKGVSPITVASIAGHSSTYVTLKLYAQQQHGVTPNLNKLMR